jgi:hypothetical protein
MNIVFKKYFLGFVLAVIAIMGVGALGSCDTANVQGGVTTSADAVSESPSGSATTTKAFITTTAVTTMEDVITGTSAIETVSTTSATETVPTTSANTTTHQTTAKPAETTAKPPVVTTESTPVTTAPPQTTTPPQTTAPEAPSDTPSNPPTEPPYIKYAVYLEMSGAEQQAYFMQFTSPQAFFDWRNKALKEYEDEREDIEIDGDGPIIIG